MDTVLVVLLGVLFLVAFFLWLDNRSLRSKLSELFSKKQSLSTRYGLLTEQFMPFLQNFPYDPKRFRFLGNPVDGVVFGENEIVFLEFKAADSKLSGAQKKIKSLVEGKKVFFKTLRLS